MTTKRQLVSLTCAAAMVCTVVLTSAMAETPETDCNLATVGDALDIMRDCVGLPNDADVSTHDFNGNGELDIGDALLVLRGVVGIGEPMTLGNGDESESTEFYTTTVPGTPYSEPEVVFNDVVTPPQPDNRPNVPPLPPVAPPEPDDTHIREYLDRAITEAVNSTSTRRATQFEVHFFSFVPFRLAALTEFYVPDVEIDGFELCSVSINGGTISYEFAPINQEFCTNNGIEVIVVRTDSIGTPLPNSTLEEVSNAVAHRGAEMRGGFVYTPDGFVFGLLDRTWFMVRSFQTNDYDFLRDIAQQVIDTAELVRVDVG